MAENDELSTKGLDVYAENFLQRKTEGAEEITITKGQDLSEERIRNFQEQQKRDFIKRAGTFTEDLIGYIIEQKQIRNVDDRVVIFSLALANINLRASFCNPQNEEEVEKWTPEKTKNAGKEWDTICWAAQAYFDENT